MSAWDSFRRLVYYYRDCVLQEERSGPIFNISNLDRTFCVPVLEYDWLRELGKPPAEIGVRVDIDGDGNFFVMQRLKTRDEFDEEIYIGYPTEVFRWNGGTYCAPIALVPVDVDFKKTIQTILQLKIRAEDASINQAWLERKVSPDEKKRLERMVESLHRDDEFAGLFDLRRALPYLAKVARAEGAKIPSDAPNGMEYTFPTLARDGARRFCNTPILFIGQKPQYTKTLRNEMKYIAEQPDSVLDKTALAYVFRDPPLPPPERENFYVFPFIEANDEQHAAVSNAIECAVSKVTGPPGTGKSQVAANCIANLIVHGKSVLFTSRNHKAVHAIFERCAKFFRESKANGLPENFSKSLINFCSLPDGDLKNPWTSLDFSAMCVNSCDSGNLEVAREAFAEAEEEWACLEKKVNGRAARSRRYAHLQGRAESWEKFLAPWHNFSPKELKQIAQALSEKPSGGGLRAFVALLFWRIFRERKHNAAMARLTSECPDVEWSICDVALVKRRLRRTAARMLIFEKNIRRRKDLENENATDESDFSQERAMEVLQRLEVRLRENAWRALACELLKKTEFDSADMRGFQKRFKKKSIPDDVSFALEKFSKILRLVPAWASTLLSLRQASPCLPGIFDRVIIDEASQCDVAPLVPALFRAKGVVAIGDPAQFPPVRTLRPVRNEYLRKHHNLTEDKFLAFDYLEESVYSVVTRCPVVFLRAHFRCNPEIAEYFNRVFYSGKLDVFSIAETRALGLRPGVDWIDVRDSFEGEVQAVEKRLGELKNNPSFTGSVGVITPLKKTAEELGERLVRFRDCFSTPLVVSTVNGFQGGERDVIIFMTGYVSTLSSGEKWYVTSEENRYIYNVAASRAKCALTIVGDRSRCADSDFPPLRELADLAGTPRSAELRPHFESVWEERLAQAMAEAGIDAISQYPLSGRRLDFAVLRGNVKLDVEVDGVRWHTTYDGQRKFDDIWRDAQISAAGWRVLRFWVYELRGDMPACIQKIKSVLSE